MRRLFLAMTLLALPAASLAGCGVIVGIGDVTAANPDGGGTDGATPTEAAAPVEGGGQPDSTVGEAGGGDATAPGNEAGASDTGPGDDASDTGAGDAGTDAAQDAGQDAGSPLGAACVADAGQCASGFCVDGICCESACNGSCEVCGGDAGAEAGACVAVTSGPPRGSREPCTGAGTACAGTCASGNTTTCTYPGSATVCTTASCAAGKETPSSNCDGAGNCPAASPVTCSPLACNDAGTECAGACTGDSQCATPPNLYCNSGACLATKENGLPCTAPSQCTNNECVDGTCCNSACTGQCQACDLTGALLGKCSAVTSGQPVGGREVCTGSGVDGGVDGGVCGGSCSSSVADTTCSYPSVACRSASCSGGVAVTAATCASGLCPAEATTTCAPYLCSTSSCEGSCTTDTECASDAYCSSSHTCALQETSGQKCNTASSGDCAQTGCRECGTTGGCVDSYCCSAVCTGACQTCSATPGTCTTLASGSSCGASGSGETCTGTTCACPSGETLCGTTCVNLETDPTYCGSCSAAACTGLCSGGQCYPGVTVLCSTNVDAYDIATDGVNVYWTNSSNGFIEQCAATGCDDPYVLAHDSFAPQSIVTDGVNVYWGDRSNILSAPVNVFGSTPTTLASGGEPVNLALGGGSSGGVGKAAGMIFWTDNSLGELLGVATTGNALFTSTVIASGQDTPIGVATDSNFVYWTDFNATGGIFFCALQLSSCSPATISSPVSEAEWVAGSGGTAYWSTYNSSEIGLYSSSRGSGTLYGPVAGQIYGLTTDGNNLYALTLAGLLRCSTSGCEGGAAVLGPGGGTGPVLDSTYVYWTSGSQLLRSLK